MGKELSQTLVTAMLQALCLLMRIVGEDLDELEADPRVRVHRRRDGHDPNQAKARRTKKYSPMLYLMFLFL